MNNNLIINMKEEGVDGAVGRVLGIQLKDKIINKFEPTTYDKIVLDFSNVDFITSGFAKELFGGLCDSYKENFKQYVLIRINKENATLKNTIIRALSTYVDRK